MTIKKEKGQGPSRLRGSPQTPARRCASSPQHQTAIESGEFTRREKAPVPFLFYRSIVYSILALGLMLTASTSFAADASPKRIASLKPNITEIVFALGLGDRLVGVTRYCDYPPEAKDLPVVADYTRPYLEKIIALSPDLILGSEENAMRRPIERLKRLGYNVQLFPFSTLSHMINSIDGIASVLGNEAEGKRVVGDFKIKLDLLKKRYEDRMERSVVVIVGTRPLIAAGRGTYIDELLEIVSAENAVAAGKIKYPRIDVERLISLNPDAIVDASMGSESRGSKTGRPWDGIDVIKAVRNGNVIPIDMSELRPSIRVINALERLGKHLHGI